MRTNLLYDLSKQFDGKIFLSVPNVNQFGGLISKSFQNIHLVEQPEIKISSKLKSRILKYIYFIHCYGMPNDKIFSATWVKYQNFKWRNDYSNIKKSIVKLLISVHRQSFLFRNILNQFQLWCINSNNFKDFLWAKNINTVILDGFPNLIPAAPFWIAACKNLGIGSVTIVTNWDHPTCRGYAGIKSKYYYVWGNSMRNELQTHHDIDPQYIKEAGSLLFDFYSHPNYLNRQNFLKLKSEFSISDKYVLIITNSPNYHHNLKIIKFIRNNLENDIQLVVRLHPSFLHKPYKERLQNHIRYNQENDNVIYFFPQLNDSLIPTDMSYEEIQLSSSLVANAQVFINLMSTMILDGIISNKKLINIVFDWEKDDWSILKLGLSKNRIHLNRTLDNKLMYFARNRTELIALIKSFINEPSNSNGKYLNIDHTIKAECGPIDGNGNRRIISMINKAAKMVGNG